MQFSTNKAKTTTVLIVFLLITSITLMTMPVQPAQAQTTGSLPAGVTPDITVATTAYLSIRPTTVGIDQTFLVNLFPVPAPNANPKLQGLKSDNH